MAIVGVDTFGISYVAPFLGAEYALSTQRVGLLFTATVAASLLGAIGIAPWSDRIGRRGVLLLAVLLVGMPGALIALTRNYPMLLALRLLVGLGFGASLPVAVALVSESVLARHRSLAVTVTGSAIVAGMALAGVAASLLIPAFGWRSMLYASAALSLIVAFAVFMLLPESPLMHRTTRPSAPDDSRDWLRGTLLRSLLLGLLLTMSFLVVNFAAYWLPTIILNQGYSVEQTGAIGSSRQILTVLLGILLGWGMDRAGVSRVLVFCYLSATLLFFCVAGASALPVALGLLLLALSMLSAGLSGSMVYVTGFYAPEVRATALGRLHGVARVVGGSVGTYVGGVLVGKGWTQAQLATVIGCAAAIGAAALIATRYARIRAGQGAGA